MKAAAETLGQDDEAAEAAPEAQEAPASEEAEA